jgi:hypothetical protein
MKKLVAFSLLAVASAAVAAPFATPSPDAWVGARPAVKVSVASVGAGKFRVNATVRDLRNGNVLSEPVLVATAGAPAKVEIGATGTPGSTVVAFTVTVAPDGRSASYSSEIRSNGEVVAAEEATLAVGR